MRAKPGDARAQRPSAPLACPISFRHSGTAASRRGSVPRIDRVSATASAGLGLALWESSGVRGGERGDAPGPGHEGDMPLLKPGVSCLDSMEHGFESMLQCVWLQPCRRARCSGPHASASHPPLVLPLRHFLCVPCARRLKGDGQTKCPICNRTVLMWAVQKR